MRQRIATWFQQIREDVKQSADPGLLAVLRVFGLLYGRIDRRIPIDESLRMSWSRKLPANVTWKHAFGGVAYFLFGILVVTGVLMTFYYRPSIEEAYPSIQYIVSEAPFGWLWRDMHVWAANLIVLALLAHMARVLFAGAYKPPRETSWFIGLLLLLVIVFFGMTGYLLPWDQWAYWTTAEFMTGVEAIPLVGGMVATFFRGDQFVSSGTLSRFFALHVIVLPWLAFGLLSLHFLVVRGQGIAGSELADPEKGTPFYPRHLMRVVVLSVLLIAVVGSLAALLPRPIGDVADPFTVPAELVSSWVIVDVTMGVLRLLGPFGATAILVLFVVLTLVPFFDRKPVTEIRKRPGIAALGALLIGGFLLAWIVGHRVEVSPDAMVPREILEERAVPPEGAPVDIAPDEAPADAEAQAGEEE